MPERILVTGGAGYIGSHAASRLLEMGQEVIVLDNLSTGLDWIVPKKCKFIQGEIGDREVLGEIFQTYAPSSIWHFAALSTVEDSVREPLRYFKNNTADTLTLLETAIEYKISRFLFSSTCSVYGTPKKNPIDEEAEKEPISPYGLSKWATEKMLHCLAKACPEFRYVVLRYFNVAGAKMDGTLGESTIGSKHLIKRACEVALGKREHLEIYGRDYPTPDGTCIRDYIHVEDLVTAHLAAENYLKQNGKSDVFNVGYGKGFSVLEVVEEVRRCSGKVFKTVDAPPRQGDPAQLFADPTKIRSLLNWVPKYDEISAICESAWRWECQLNQRQ